MLGGPDERIVSHRTMLSSREVAVKLHLPRADEENMEMPAEPHPAALEIVLETFRPDDIEAIAELVRGCAARPEESLGSWEWGDAALLGDDLDRWPVRASETLYVARGSGRVVGFCGVECYPAEGIGLVHGPVVAPAARGVGIGRTLFDVALRTGERHGAAELWAVPGRDNRRAQALLARSGFTRNEVSALFRLERTAHTPLPVPMDVRRASSDDLPEVLALAEALGDDLHMTLDELSEALSDPDWRVFIAGAPELRAIACIDPRDGWIAALATHAQARRRGVGATLLSAVLEDWWGEHPDSVLGLTVRAESLSVLTQYHRLGFEPHELVARHSRR
jgi:N-acetylglutamate synthase-like GNAT family acetyltransferase